MVSPEFVLAGRRRGGDVHLSQGTGVWETTRSSMDYCVGSYASRLGGGTCREFQGEMGECVGEAARAGKSKEFAS